MGLKSSAPALSMPHLHDTLFRAIFQDPAEAADLARGLVPPSVSDELAWEALTPLSGALLDAQLRARVTDLRFEAPWRRGGHAQLTLLFEHQSRPDPDMPWRVHQYVQRVWEDHRARAPRAPLPLVLPIVVFHGPRRWRAPRSLSALIDAPEAAKRRLGRYVPELQLFLEDLNARSDADLPGRDGGRLALMLLRRSHDPDLWPIISGQLDLLAALKRRRGDTPALAVLKYVYERSDRSPEPTLLAEVREILNPPAQEDLMRYGERLRMEGRLEGRQEATLESLQRALLSVVRVRFGAPPDWVEAKIKAADADTLLAWITLAAAAQNLDAVFSPA